MKMEKYNSANCVYSIKWTKINQKGQCGAKSNLPQKPQTGSSCN